MRTLRESEGLTQRQLTQLMSSDPNTVASLLERMERAGLVERRPHARDKRAHQVELKPSGHRKYELAREIAVDLQVEVLKVLPVSERESFLSQLAVVADACRQAAGGETK